VPGYTELGPPGAGGPDRGGPDRDGSERGVSKSGSNRGRPGRAATTTTPLTVPARHTATGARVAIHYLADDRRLDDAWLAAYREDTRLLAELDSPHVVGLYEYVESADGAATVHEYVDGVTLADLAGAGKPMKPEAALSVLKGALLGLTAARAAGVRRCRFSRAGVLIDGDGHTRLADDADDPAEHPPAEDVSAAYSTVLECAALARLPKPLRRLEAAGTTGDGAALLAELDSAARAAYGADWEAKGRSQLAQAVDRLRRQRRAGH
jgi:serine/threonine-protein kinase